MSSRLVSQSADVCPEAERSTVSREREADWSSAILDALTAHIAVLDIEGNIVAVNAAWKRFAIDRFGALERCGVGSNYLAACRDAGGVECSDDVLSGLSAVLTGRSDSFTFEYPRHESGHERWFLLTASPLPGPDRGAVVAYADVTANRTAEEAIRRKERWFRTLARHATDIVAVVDQAGLVRYVSPSIESILGHRPEDLVGTDAFAFDHPDDLPRLQLFYAEMLGRPGVASRAELRVRHADGSWRWLEVCATNLLDDPDVEGIVVNARDVTERIKAQTRLEQQERWYRTLVQHAADLVSVIAADGAVRYQSPALERLLGYRPQERSGTNGLAMIHEEDLPRVRQALTSIAGTPGASYTMELRAQHRDGSWRWLEATAISLLDDPTVAGFVINSRDITERKRLEDDLRQREARHRALLDAIPDMIFRFDRNGVYLDVKAEQSSALAMPAEMLLGRHVMDVLPAKVARQALDAVDRALCTGQMETFEYRLELPNGAREFEARTLASGDHETVSLVRDVTERRQSEIRLQKSEERLRLSLEAAQVGAWDWHLPTDTVVLSPTFSELLGLPAESRTLTIRAFRAAFVHPDDRLQTESLLKNFTLGDAFGEMEYRIVRADGEVRWVVDKGRLVEASDDGTPLRSAGVTIDVTALKRTKAALELRDRALAAASSGVLILDATQPDPTITDVNPAFERMTGYSREEILGRSPAFLDGPETDAAALNAIEDAFLEGRETTVTFVNYRKDGSQFWAELHLAPVRDGEGRLTHFVGILNDISERTWAEGELRFRGELLDQATVGVIARDLSGTVTHWNRHAQTLYGWRRQEAVGSNIADLLAHELDSRMASEIEEALMEGRAWEGEFVCRRKDGTEVPVHVVDSPVHGNDGRPVGYVSVAVDVSERKAFERELERRAYSDDLTGLPNRALFRDKLADALSDEHRAQFEVAVLIIDLDRFKSVNDTFGHPVGDRALIEVAHRLSGCMGADEVLARFGGDEFAVLIRAVDAELRANEVASAILCALTHPITIGDGEGVLTGSVGIAIARPDSTPDHLLRDADVALYQVKGTGRNDVAVFDPATGGRAAERWRLENELRGAAERGELRLVYQPLVDLVTGRVLKAEALVRWEHPERGTVSPAEFIPLAEESGLIIPLGAWVVRSACETAASWPADQAIGVSVNLSPRQLHDPGLPAVVSFALAESGLAPDRLTLEITESAAIRDLDAAATALSRLKELGVRLALDDFGTGYSSLAHLRRLPVDAVKVDRAFVSGDGSDRSCDRAVVGAIAALGHALGLVVVAEGIETVQQRVIARRAGCDIGQGYFFSRPLSAGAFARWLAAPRSTSLPDRLVIRVADRSVPFPELTKRSSILDAGSGRADGDEERQDLNPAHPE